MALNAIRELVTILGFKIDDAEARRYDKRLKDMGRRIRSFGKTMSLFVTAPIVGLGTAFVKAAADAEETENKFHEVYSSIRDEADATAKALASDFDLANVSAQEMLATTGDILVGFGFTEKAALDLSKQVNSLAVDIASFKNVQGGAAQASNAITKALLGEREMLKGIGIAILEEDVKRKIAQLTAEGMTFETNRQAKSFATLQIIMERSTKAIGDYARTSQSATNQARKLRERFRELSVTFGKVLLPLATDLLKVLNGFLEWMNSFSPRARRIIIIIAAVTAALGPLLIVLGSIVGLLAAIPLAIPAAIAAIAALGFLIGEDIRAFFEGRKSVLGLIVNAGKQAIDRIFEYASQKWSEWIDSLAALMPSWMKRYLGIEEARGVTTSQGGRDIAAQTTLEWLMSRLLGVRQISTPRDAFGAFRNQGMAGAAQAITNQGDMTVNLTVNAAQGMSEAGVARLTIEEMQRLAAEGRSRAAIAPWLGP
jgi:hypothetical protein